MENHNLEIKKKIRMLKILKIIIFIAICLVGFLIYSVIAKAEVVDNMGILENATIEKIKRFETLTSKTLDFHTVLRSTDALENALEIYDNSTSDFLIFYSVQDREFVVVQPTDNIILEEDLKKLVDETIEAKILAEDYPELNIVFSAFIDNLIVLIKPESEAKIFCEILKDGVCDKQCPGYDLDCDCGDKICQEHEAYETCPSDCKQEKNYLCAVIRDNECDETCPGDIDCANQKLLQKSIQYYEKSENAYSYIVTVFGIITFVLIGITLYIIKEIYKVKL